MPGSRVSGAFQMMRPSKAQPLDGRRRRPLREGDAPGERGRAPVIVADEETPDAPNRMAQRERRRRSRNRRHRDRFDLFLYYTRADRSEVYFVTSVPEPIEWATRESWSAKGDVKELRAAYEAVTGRA